MLSGAARAQELPEPHAPLVGSTGYTSQPNIFGGQTYRLDAGRQIETQPNIFRGRDVRGADGTRLTCVPNLFGGEDCQR